MINIVIPMAGKGQRFLEKGIKTPKPLIQINSKPFISHVVDSVNFEQANFYLDLEGHLEQPEVKKALEELGFHTETLDILGVYEASSFRQK